MQDLRYHALGTLLDLQKWQRKNSPLAPPFLPFPEVS